MIRSQLHLIGQPVRSLQTMLRTISFAYPFLPRLTPVSYTHLTLPTKLEV